MIVSGVSGEVLSKALEMLNKKYDNNIIWNNYVQLSSSRFRLTLRCLSSKGLGHRRGFSFDSLKGRHLISACWHVHGSFFDAIFNFAPDALIYARGKKITADYGNWEDTNIGSSVRPFYFSEACDCEY